MIAMLSNKLATRMKEVNPEKTASVEVMAFALQGLIQNVLSVMLAIIIGLLVGKPWETIIAFASFMGLRVVSGGFHFKSALLCLIFSASIFIVVPFFTLSDSVLVLLNLLSLIIVTIFAPANVKEHLRLPEKQLKVFKFVSMVLVAANFVFLTSVVTVAFFAQSITLININRR